MSFYSGIREVNGYQIRPHGVVLMVTFFDNLQHWMPLDIVMDFQPRVCKEYLKKYPELIPYLKKPPK